MTAPNAAVGALPGWRGTDPHGGTWVRLTRRSGHPWLEITATGGLHFRTQEEAEAAGLVPLVAETKRGRVDLTPGDYWLTSYGDGKGPAIVTNEGLLLVEQFPSRETKSTTWSDMTHLYHPGRWKIEPRSAVPAAPAPLDPGNPEDWRKHAVMSRHLADRCMGTANDEVLEAAANLADRMADRLDREHAEAEQDAADRAEADNYAKESSTTEEFWARHNAYLDGIRAERARQEAGQS